VSTKRRRPANGHERTCSAIIAGTRLPHFCVCQPFIPDAVECRRTVPAATADGLADHHDRLPPEKRGFSQPLTAAMDLFVVPTIGFDLLHAYIIVRLDRRELIWISVTTHPTAEWVARQITEAFPWNEAPRYMIRDRDRIYGAAVTRRLRAVGIRDKPIAPSSPWQNVFAERLIGSIRRECVDHIIVLGEAHLRRILKSYADYYNGARTHRSLNKDAPVSRAVQRAGVIRSRASSVDFITTIAGLNVFGTHNYVEPITG
jgi:transposase InsO family protein